MGAVLLCRFVLAGQSPMAPKIGPTKWDPGGLAADRGSTAQGDPAGHLSAYACCICSRAPDEKNSRGAQPSSAQNAR